MVFVAADGFVMEGTVFKIGFLNRISERILHRRTTAAPAGSA